MAMSKANMNPAPKSEKVPITTESAPINPPYIHFERSFLGALMGSVAMKTAPKRMLPPNIHARGLRRVGSKRKIIPDMTKAETRVESIIFH